MFFSGKRYSENGFGGQGKCDRRILWSGQGATIWVREFMLSLYVVSVFRAFCFRVELEIEEI